MEDPLRLGSGLQALEIAHQTAAFTAPLSLQGTSGHFDIGPGTWDRRERRLILGQSQDQVVYLQGDDLFSAEPAGEWMQALLSDAADRGEAPAQLEEMQRSLAQLIPDLEDLARLVEIRAPDH